MKDTKQTAKGFIAEKLNKKTDKDESFSDDEEREDKQYISNKVFIKY